MGFLPTEYNKATAEEKAARGYNRATDGEYTFLIKDVSYDDVRTKKGTTEKALIMRHRVVESKPLPNQPAGVAPVAAGEDLDYFLPDYGDAKVMLKKNLKAYVLGLLGLDEKTVDPNKLAETIGLIGGPRQLARGMYIRGVTFHVNKRDSDDDFMGFNWSPVPGQNVPDSPEVLARRKAIESETTSETPTSAGTANGTPAGATVATSSATAPAGGAPAIPAIPAIPQIPAIPAADPMAGWMQHPSNPAYYYRPDQSYKSPYTREEIVAGTFSRG